MSHKVVYGLGYFFVQTSRFREFWDEANRNRDILEVVPGKTICNAAPASVLFCWALCEVSLESRPE